LAVELSDSTFKPAARFTGAATLALTSDISSRSGSSDASCDSSSSG
jgi:hypothetical protein